LIAAAVAARQAGDAAYSDRVRNGGPQRARRPRWQSAQQVCEFRLRKNRLLNIVAALASMMLRTCG
jgi:hypothetical protein